MAKEVILMDDVDGLGRQGDVVRVAEGYARNYLVPRNLAAPVTDATRRRIEKRRKDREVKLVADKSGAESLAQTLENTSVTISVKTASEGKLFGSVTPADIAKALAGQGIAVDRHKIELEEPIREVGVFKVPVKLHPDVRATVKVWVVEE
jgi:large subunit ribosomal protein L9